MNYPSIVGLIIGIAGIAVLLYLGKKVFNPYWKSVWRSGFLFFSMYILILVVVFIRWSQLESQLDAYDLNLNGTIEMAEYTEEYMTARDQLFDDTARNYAFWTGAILSFLMAALALGIDLLRTYFRLQAEKIEI